MDLCFHSDFAQLEIFRMSYLETKVSENSKGLHLIKDHILFCDNLWGTDETKHCLALSLYVRMFSHVSCNFVYLSKSHFKSLYQVLSLNECLSCVKIFIVILSMPTSVDY